MGATKQIRKKLTINYLRSIFCSRAALSPRAAGPLTGAGRLTDRTMLVLVVLQLAGLTRRHSVLAMELNPNEHAPLDHPER